MTSKPRQRRIAPLLLALALQVPRLGRAATADQVEESAPQGVDRPNWRTLAERIPSVTRRTVVKAGRFELEPHLNASLNDPFYQLIGGGVAAHLHVLESLSLGVSGGYLGGFDATIAVAGGTDPSQGIYNRPRYYGRLEAAWAPLYGKISWMAESASHFDTYLAASLGTLVAAQGGASPAAGLALGQRYYITPALALKIALRQDWYRMARTPSLEAHKDVQTLLSVTVGVSFFFPNEKRPSL